MIVMPILNKNKNGVSKIYNVRVSLKNATKVKESTILKGYGESDIIINGTSFNNSTYNKKGIEPNATVNFLREYNYRECKKEFLITTRENPDSTLYDLYNVEMPPRKITAGLDNLYGSMILDMKKELPGSKKGKYISLRKLGIEKNLTNEKIDKLKEIMNLKENETRKSDLMQLNGVSDLQNTVNYMQNFDYIIINESTIPEEQLNLILNSFSKIKTKDFKNLSKYYEIAKENRDVYTKLTMINKILYNKPINLIKGDMKQKKLIKIPEEVKNAS